MAELVNGSGIEIESQYVTPGSNKRYDRVNQFRPSINSLPRLLGILAAILAGLLVGFAGIFNALENHWPGSFRYDVSGWVYFSVATFATVGYGDITPVSALARITVIAEIVIGMITNAVLISSTVSWLISDARLRRDAADTARGKRMKRREEWFKAAKVGLYGDPGEMERHIREVQEKTNREKSGNTGVDPE
ncbi:MAG TPA: potassium channel family protein [Pirellulales bacterium]|jgi:hypothetical protein